MHGIMGIAEYFDIGAALGIIGTMVCGTILLTKASTRPIIAT